jgi:hypothetical protein
MLPLLVLLLSRRFVGLMPTKRKSVRGRLPFDTDGPHDFQCGGGLSFWSGLTSRWRLLIAFSDATSRACHRTARPTIHPGPAKRRDARRQPSSCVFVLLNLLKRTRSTAPSAVCETPLSLRIPRIFAPMILSIFLSRDCFGFRQIRFP